MAEPAIDTPPHWLTAERLRVYPLLIVAIVGAVAVLWVARTLPGMVDPRGKPVGWDFITFWSAARLALAGRPEAAFDPAAMGAAQHLAVPGMGDALFLWHYPPSYLLLLLPLGLLAYPMALLAFSGAGVALWMGLARALFRDRRAWLVAAATPAGLINLIDGQNGFLTAGLAGFALIQLERRPRLAGMLIGLLAVKPHLAALFPLALIASRRWRVLVWAAASGLVVSAAGVAAFGLPTTLAFLHDLPQLRDIVDRGGLPWSQMPSPYVLLLSAGAAPLAAALAQAVAALAALGCVWRAWRGGDVPFDVQAAVLCAATLLVSPYLFTYDLTWGALALGFLARAGLRGGFAPAERDVLVACWVAPLGFVPLYWLCGVQAGCVVPVVLLALATRRVTASPSASRPG